MRFWNTPCCNMHLAVYLAILQKDSGSLGKCSRGIIMMTSSNGNIFRVNGTFMRGIHIKKWISLQLSYTASEVHGYKQSSELVLGLCPANERFVTTSLIGCAQAKNQPWSCVISRITKTVSVVVDGPVEWIISKQVECPSRIIKS